MNYYVQLMILTVTTVMKLMMVIVFGAIGTLGLKSGDQSVRGFSYVSLHVFLPCLLFTNLGMNVTWEALAEYYWAPLLAFLPMAIGFGSAFVLRLFLGAEYLGTLVLACTFQNGLTFPLGLIYTIRGLKWLTPEAQVRCESYIFLYNIVCSIALFALGEPFIAYCARKEQREAQLRSEAEAADATNEAAVTSGNNAAGEEVPMYTPYTTPAAQLQRYRAAKPTDKPIHLAKPSSNSSNSNNNAPAMAVSAADSSDGTIVLADAKAPAMTASLHELWRRARPNVMTVVYSPPVASSVLAIFFALTPPLRWLLHTLPGQLVVDSMSVIGAATIPMQLIVLGSTMARNGSRMTKQMPPAAPPATGGGEEGDDGAIVPVNATSCAVPRRWWHALQGSQARFIICTIVLRLLLVPAICFGVLYALTKAKLVPLERPFLFTMLLEFCAPSAINGSLLCVMHSYRVRQFAQFIIVMYVVSMGTMGFWLFVYILYLGKE